MVVRYRYVSRPKIRGQDAGWVAQKRNTGLYRARFATAREAATWLARKLRIPVERLRRPRASVVRRQVVEAARPTAAFHMSGHRGVIADRGRWVARAGGFNLGRFGSELAAARCVARVARCKVKSLKRPSATRAVLRRLFAAGMQAFEPYTPGDLKTLREQEQVSKAMFEKETPLSQISSCGQVVVAE